MTTKVANLDARRRGVGRLLRFCTGETAQSNKVKNIELRWAELGEQLRTPHVGAETLEEYLKLPTPEQLSRKDVGYVMPGHMDKGIRGKANIHLRSCLVMDIDHAPQGAIERICDPILGLGRYTFYLHSTRKHKDDAPRLRLYMPVTRDVAALEHSAIIRRIAADLQPLGDESSSIDWFDDTGFEFTRVAFWPSISKGADYVFVANEGEWLEPDAILALYADPMDVSSWPVSEKLRDTLRLSAKRSGDPLTKPGIIGAFNRVYSIHHAMEEYIPGVYVHGAHDDRMTYAAGSSANGALIYDNGLFLFSRHESDPCYYQNCNAFDMVRIHLFGDLDSKVSADTPINQKPSFKAMQARAAEDPQVRTELLMARTADRAHDFDEFDEEQALEEPIESSTPTANEFATFDADETAAEPPPTTDKAKLKEDRKAEDLAQVKVAAAKALHSDKGALVPCLATLEALLEHDPRLKDCVATNLFTGDLLQMRKLPHMRVRVPPEGVLWSDLAELKIKSYLEQRYHLFVSATAVHEAACSVGDKRAFNPVKNRLEALPAWDGASRIESFFIRHLGCPDTPYYRDVSRKFFVAAVSRVYRPGCKFDSMLVLEGPEGIGKSTLGKVLAFGHFTDEMSFGFDSKEVVERSRGSWIVEIPEMVTRSNADSQHVLQFITRQVERVRLSYARNAGDFPRQFVMIGTTNETSDYLRTTAGNRRFWCIRCSTAVLDMQAIITEREQLWAEALVYMGLNEPLFLEGAALKEAQAVQAERVIKDDVSGVIEAWLNQKIRTSHWEHDPSERGDFDDEDTWVERDRVCAVEIWVECLKGQIDRFTRREAMRINAVMNGLADWEQKPLVRFGKRYGTTRGFFRRLLI